MSILNIQQLQVGRVGVNPQKLLINTDNTIAEITTAGYLTKYGSYSTVAFSDYQLAEVYTTDGKVGVYRVSVDANGIASLVANTDGNVTLPVASGDFAVFDGITGIIKDAGYSASNAAKTKVMMADATMVANNFITAADTAGTGKDSLKSASNAAKTKVVMADAATTIGNMPVFTDTAGTIGNGPVAGNVVLTSAITTPDVSINLVRFDATVTTTALASGAVTLFTSSGAKQYKIVALWLNFAANLAVGDKNLAIGDGTTVYSVIPTTSLLTLVNAGWGDAGVPYPASAALNISTAAGASLTATYSGGTTNYTGGASFVISGILQRVA